MTPQLIPDEFPPKNCSMTDLGHLDLNLSVPLMMRRNFIGAGPPSTISWGRVMNFVRLVDALLRSYHHLRLHLLDFINDPTNTHFASLFMAIEQAEFSVITMVRACTLAKAIKRDLKGPRQTLKHIPILEDSVNRLVREMRNAIEHLDGDLNEGEWKEGWSLALQLKSDRMVFPNVSRLPNEGEFLSILYSDFERWIEQLWKIAKLQLDYIPPSSSPI